MFRYEVFTNINVDIFPRTVIFQKIAEKPIDMFPRTDTIKNAPQTLILSTRPSGMMGTDQALLDQLSRAGEATGERVWELPFWDEYHEMIKSDIADLKNMAGRPAGSITAGAFLAAFVGDCPFAHIDIAGTAWADQSSKPYDTNGATGVGVRLITEFLRRYQ